MHGQTYPGAMPVHGGYNPMLAGGGAGAVAVGGVGGSVVVAGGGVVAGAGPGEVQNTFVCALEAEAQPELSYVGMGGGSYVQEVHYRYVGHGGGEFDVMVKPKGCCTGNCFFAAGCITSGFAILALVLWIFIPPWTTSSTTYFHITRPQLPIYDCTAGWANWKIEWGAAKKAWCCKHAGNGCEPPDPWTTLPPENYDCQAGWANWEAGWSQGKKDYCCETQGKGCSPATTTGPLYDCAAAWGNWQLAWSNEKKDYCCQNLGKGCSPVPPTDQPTFDCEAGWANWQTEWSEPKRLFCCRKEGRGCIAATTPAPYDCEAGWANWQDGWSWDKKQWCCQSMGRGCTPATTAPPYDCEAGWANWQAGWSWEQKQYCCQTAGRGCTPETTAAAYDCEAGWANWQAGWSAEKKMFCCQTMGRGCEPETTVGMYDCTAGWANWKNGWSMSKKQYCCEQYGKGCNTNTPSIVFDCDAGWANWQRGWSEGKKDECCRTQGKGCSWGTTVGPWTPAPPTQIGFCLIWGDPHIRGFDGSHADFYGEGEVWLVKSARVHIQGRYRATPFTEGLAAMEAIGVGGPCLRGHRFVVEPMEMGHIYWDDGYVLRDFPSTFDPSGFGTISYNGDGQLVDGAMAHYEKHIVHVDLPRCGVHLQILRWSHHINVRISMTPATGGQDGHCGNFNADPSDDTKAQIIARIGWTVPREDILFDQYVPYRDTVHKHIEDCPQNKRDTAKADCMQARPGITDDMLTACIIDVCFSGERYAAQDSAY